MNYYDYKMPRLNAKKTVTIALDIAENAKDVAKYLMVVTQDIVLLVSLSSTIRKRLEQRMKNKLTMHKALN